MTKMLVNFAAKKIDNNLIAKCDIVEIYYSNSQFNLANQHAVTQALSCPAMLSLNVDELNKIYLLQATKRQELLKFYDFIKLEIPLSLYNESLSNIKKLAQKKPLIVHISHYNKISDVLSLFGLFAASGIYGVMLAPNESQEKLTKIFSIASIGNFIEQAHKHGLAACLTGDIEAPDIARLLPFSPDIFGFDESQFGINGVYDEQQSDLIRSLIPSETDVVDYDSNINLGTDRILINNFILPIAIGAYNHERNRLQKVRFSVAVDVLRLSLNPEDMRHIFSYDLIIDGIKRLALLEHVDLVETLAERIAAFILAYPRVQKVMVRVEKLELEPEAVGIEIERVKST